MNRLARLLLAPSLVCALSLAPLAPAVAEPLRSVPLAGLRADLQVGDLVFVRVTARPFVEVADATGSWTNHVGIVVDTVGDDVTIAESTLPRSRTTSLARFVGRSEAGRVAVRRLPRPLTQAQRDAVRRSAERRLGVHYDTGFDLHSRGQFCSRFVREVLLEATGDAVGEVQTFATLLKARPDTKLDFWQTWFLGSIPWQRETVTPASQLDSPRLVPVFDGRVSP